MAENTKNEGVLLVPESDYVKVQDADGVVQEHPVPKAWVGTDLLPGWKAVGRSTTSDNSGSGDSGVPSVDAKREDLEAYAVENGMSEEEAKGYANKAERHAAIVASSTPTQF
jgi:hypothetical protein